MQVFVSISCDGLSMVCPPSTVGVSLKLVLVVKIARQAGVDVA